MLPDQIIWEMKDKNSFLTLDLYKQAKSEGTSANYAKLWGYLVQYIFFATAYIVSFQQDFAHYGTNIRDSDKHIDILVETIPHYPNSDTHPGALLVFITPSQPDPHQLHHVTDLQFRARAGARAYCQKTGLKHIWVMTCIGTFSKTWVYDADRCSLITHRFFGEDSVPSTVFDSLDGSLDGYRDRFLQESRDRYPMEMDLHYLEFNDLLVAPSVISDDLNDYSWPDRVYYFKDRFQPGPGNLKLLSDYEG
ncbi:hypothetical protein B0J18DRAFT_481041 [Chaetomium sp. MPI-SDFR-AT-0129]|nr:hypothetical protein B0J18DRAFT_481041 [Chaetomium sp. MPI-SDFR-AT-0129]